MILRRTIGLLVILLLKQLTLFAQFPLLKTLELPKSVIQAVYSPDGKKIAVVHANKQIHLFNAQSFELITILDDKGEGDVSIAFSPDGNYLLSGSWDKSLKLWDLAKQKIVRRYYGHSQATRCVAFNPQGNMIVSAGWDLDIRFWYVPTGLNLKNIAGHTQCVRSLAFSPDGSKLATGGYDQLLKLWDIASGKEIFSVKTSSFPVEAVAFSPSGKYIATAGLDNAVKIWDVANGSLVNTLRGHTDAVYAIAFSPDGKYIASGGNDNVLRIWEVATGKTVQQLKAHSMGIRTIAFSPNGKQLLSGAVDKQIKIWDVATLSIEPITSIKTPIAYNNPTNIQVINPAQNPYVSTKRILPVSFEIKNSQFNQVHLFLNKYEYTRLINGNKEVVKPISVKVNTNKNIEIHYEIYLDYEQSEIQLVAFKPNSDEFILSPELIVSYFDLEKYAEEKELTLVVLNVQKYSEKKLNADLVKDNTNKLVSLLRMQEQKLFKKVTVKNISNQTLTSDYLQAVLDSMVQKKNENENIIFAINSIVIQDKESQKYFVLLPDASFKDANTGFFPLDNILKAMLKTKATAGLIVNLSNKASKLPENLTIADDDQLNKYIDKQLTARKGIFYLSVNHVQPLAMFDLIANSFHPNNDVDKNGIIDLAEVSAFLNHLAKIQVFYRPNFIPLYKK